MRIPKQAGSLPYNRAMRNLEIIVPFALLPAAHAKDLLAALRAPALARLLARAKILHQHSSEGFAPSLPHEQKLANFTDNSPPIAYVPAHPTQPAVTTSTSGYLGAKANAPGANYKMNCRCSGTRTPSTMTAHSAAHPASIPSGCGVVLRRPQLHPCHPA